MKGTFYRHIFFALFILMMNLTVDSAAQTNANDSVKKATKSAVKYTDLITKEIFNADVNATSLNVEMKKYSTRYLLASNNNSTAITIDK